MVYHGYFANSSKNNSVSILLFHEIDKETADQTFSYLKKKHNIIDLNNFLEACKNKKNIKIPKKALVLTFDDGLIKNYEMKH